MSTVSTGLQGYMVGVKPLTNVTPFTYRDGWTFERKLQYMSDYLVNIAPNLQSIVDKLLEDVSGVGDHWQTIFDQFMVNVVAELEALNDQAVANLLRDSTSEIRAALVESYSYGARVEDGTVSSAVAKAYTDKSVVYITGDNPVTDSIPNLWNVEFSGAGSITRDGFTFIPNPKPNPLVHVNNIFVNAQTGNDANDGLTPGLPLKTLSRVHTILRGLTSEQAAGATWEVRLSGVFPDGQRMFGLPDFPLELRLLGEAPVSGKPVTRINNTTASSTIGLWFEKCPSTVFVEDIHFDGFNASTGYGVLGKGGGDINVIRCRFSNCTYGTAAIRNMDYYFSKNFYESSCTNGSMTQYNSSGTWNDDTFDGCNRGVYVTRNSVAHVDYCTFINNTYGVMVDMAARAHTLGSDFRRCEVGVRALGASEWIKDTSTNFNVGTVDGNTVDYEHFGNAREARMYSSEAWSEYKIGDAWRANSAYIEPRTIGGSTGNEVVYVGSALGRLPENFFTSKYKRLRVVVRGNVSSANAYGTAVSLHAVDEFSTGNANIATGYIPSGLVGAFKMELTVYALETNAQKYQVSTIGAQDETAVHNGDRSVNMQNQKLFRLYCQNEIEADSVEFLGMETYLMG